MSGFSIGNNRKKDESACCSKCLHNIIKHNIIPDTTDPNLHESTKHLFHTCPRPVWDSILAWWSKLTGEPLEWNTSTTLLGKRSPKGRTGPDKTNFDHLHEPFALLHGITLKALWKNRNKEKGKDASTPSTTTLQIVNSIKQELQKNANDRRSWVEDLDLWAEKKQEKSGKTPDDSGPHSIAKFDRAWLHSGLAKVVTGKREKISLCW